MIYLALVINTQKEGGEYELEKNGIYGYAQCGFAGLTNK